MPQVKIDYRAPLSELIALHNQLAAERGKPDIKHCSRYELVKRLAILRTLKPLPPPPPVKQPKKKREQPIRDAIVKALTFIEYYENCITGERVSKYINRQYMAVNSVGLSYSEVLIRVRAQFPDARTTEADLRWNANQIRAKLPDIRPRS